MLRGILPFLLLTLQLARTETIYGLGTDASSFLGCVQNEVVCSTMVGQISTTDCTRYFRQCNYGEWTEPQEVAIGTYCYRGVQVNSATCSQRGGNACSFTGIQCVDGDENVITTHCTNYYQECVDGKTSNIIGTTGLLLVLVLSRWPFVLQEFDRYFCYLPK